MFKHFILFLIFQFFIHPVSFSQDHFRMAADFTTKIKPAEGKASLTKGKVYYDKYSKELIYRITFPAKEDWVVRDSKIYKIQNDSVYYSSEIPDMNEFTVFHLSLNASLSYFGLKEASFNISKVEKKGELVISYWKIPPHLQKNIRTIAVAKKGNSLHSVIIVGNEEKILSRQFFNDYIQMGGFEFPGTITQIFYDDQGRENYQVMEFKNIVLNDTEHEELYHYSFNL